MEFLDLEACEDGWFDESQPKKVRAKKTPAVRRKPAKDAREVSESEEEEKDPTPSAKLGRRNGDIVPPNPAFYSLLTCL